MIRKEVLKRKLYFLISSVLIILSLVGCSNSKDKEETTKSSETEETTEAKAEPMNISIQLNEEITYQTIESFGASGSWWSQDVGGWDNVDKDGIEVREQIAKLLFDREEGIGLSAYRYNIGAGSADSGKSFAGITDKWRRAQSFEVEPGVYDWTKDKNSIWFLDKAKEMGVSEMVFFCNSPLERLTKNGKAFGDKTDSKTSNLLPENYKEFANYIMDVVEHFISEGYPIKYISPINEPQWEWTGGQEGCHFEPNEVVEFLNVFLDVMEERNLKGVELSAPELGEWGNTSYPYFQAIVSDERLRNSLTALDVHSYWSDASAKTSFLKWLKNNNLENIELKMSEWCEMVNGIDLTMDSAINLAKEMHMDLTKLNVTTWQYWIAVSCYSYRDGLIFVNNNAKSAIETKRLWAMGNYSRFIRPGYTRIECSTDSSDVDISAYKGTDDDGKENTVVVLVNSGDNVYNINLEQFAKSKNVQIYVTDAERSLEIDETSTVPPKSVVTITISDLK